MNPDTDQTDSATKAVRALLAGELAKPGTVQVNPPASVLEGLRWHFDHSDHRCPHLAAIRVQPTFMVGSDGQVQCEECFLSRPRVRGRSCHFCRRDVPHVPGLVVVLDAYRATILRLCVGCRAGIGVVEPHPPEPASGLPDGSHPRSEEQPS